MDQVDTDRLTPVDIQVNELVEVSKKTTDLFKDTIKKVQKDNSPEAKRLRHKRLLKAVFGEFACSYIFYTCVFGGIVFTNINNFIPSLSSLVNAFIPSFCSIAIPLAFSEISGAQINPLIPISLYFTKKQNIRRSILYIIVQFIAAIFAVITMLAIFDKDSKDIYRMIEVSPVPGNVHMGNVFLAETILSFFLIYISFAVAFMPAEKVKYDQMSFKGISETEGLTIYTASPQSELGFAPFSIGFMVFGLVLMGGDSRGAFNPARMFAPALFSGNFDYLFLYLLGQLCGCFFAAFLIVNEENIIEFLFKLNLLGFFLPDANSNSARTRISIVDYNESNNVSIKQLIEAEMKSQLQKTGDIKPITPTVC